MSNLKADTITLDYLSDLHHRIAQFYQNAHNQIIKQGNTVTAELRRAERYDSNSKYQSWLDSLSKLIDEANTHQAWSDYFHHLSQEVTKAENQLT